MKARTAIYDTRQRAWKTTVMLAGLLLVVGCFIPANLYAQPGRGRGSAWSAQSTYNRLYDPNTVETLQGKIVQVDRFSTKPAGSYGIHVVLETSRETVPVHLGPVWFIENQDTQIKPGDEVEVTGSRVIFEGQPALIAAEVRRGEETLWLRDSNGVPAWQGWRRLR